MRKAELVEALREAGIIASIRVPGEQRLLGGIAALAEGGIRAVELAYTTIYSHEGFIQKLKKKGILVGIGTVTRSAQAREACIFGADFVTASVTTPDVVVASHEMQIPCVLSSLTPTEVWRAHEMEADFVKIVAAEALGGPRYIRSLRESLPASRLVAADIPPESYVSYLEAGIDVLEFGNSSALRELIERREWAKITQQTREIVKVRSNWRAGH